MRGGFRNVVTSQKSYYNQYDSVQSWLDFLYCSQAIRRFLINGQKRPGATVSSRPNLCTLFCMVFFISKTVQTGKWFGFKQWQLLSIGSSFPCGLEREVVSS